MAEKDIRVRFAPSPTGWLHVGGARTALFNWLFARSQGGVMVLRIEDTDAARNSQEAVDVILDGLRWLGLDWDEGPYYQSQRKEIYEEHLQKLRDAGRVYDEPNGAVRFRFDREPVVVHDLICGDTPFTARDEPDMTIRRPDGSFIFHFVSVVDDLTMKISHVIRGEDHLSNTWKHVELYRALGAEPPLFAHIPLILNETGSKMSKRDDGASLHSYRDDGFLPEAVVNYLALLGWSPKDGREIFSKEELAARFDTQDVNGSNARFDKQKCRWFNAEWMRRLPPEELGRAAEPFLRAEGLEGGDAAWRARAVASVVAKVETLAEVSAWIAFLFREDFPREEGVSPDSAAVGALRARFLETQAWDRASVDAAIEAAAGDLNLKPGKLMPSLRVALSGSKKGPDLHEILELLGRDRVLSRLTLTLASTPS